MYDFKIGLGDTLPAISHQITEDDGTPVDLIGATVTFKYRALGSSTEKSGAATIVDAATGQVSFTFPDGALDAIGGWMGAYYVATSGGGTRRAPKDRLLAFLVTADTTVPVGTEIAEFYDGVRFLLGDHDETIRQYEDQAIARGVRVVVRGGLVPKYKLATDRKSLTPKVDDPNDYMLICAHVARKFIGAFPDRQSVNTRAYKESVGNFRDLTFDLDETIYKLENGAMFQGWQNFKDWLTEAGYKGGGWFWFWRIDDAQPLTAGGETFEAYATGTLT